MQVYTYFITLSIVFGQKLKYRLKHKDNLLGSTDKTLTYFSSMFPFYYT